MAEDSECGLQLGGFLLHRHLGLPEEEASAPAYCRRRFCWLAWPGHGCWPTASTTADRFVAFGLPMQVHDLKQVLRLSFDAQRTTNRDPKRSLQVLTRLEASREADDERPWLHGV